MRVDIVLLLLFLFHRGEMKSREKAELSEAVGDGVKVKETLEDDVEKEELMVVDESEHVREGRDIVNDDQEEEDEANADVEVEDGEDVEGGEEDGEVTLESVRLGWDLFKEWQEVRKHKHRHCCHPH